MTETDLRQDLDLIFRLEVFRTFETKPVKYGIYKTNES